LLTLPPRRPLLPQKLRPFRSKSIGKSVFVSTLRLVHKR
jgi:hypothetical protein